MLIKKKSNLFQKGEKKSHSPEIIIVNILVSVFSDIFLCTNIHTYVHANTLLARPNISLCAYWPFELFTSKVFLHAICIFFWLGFNSSYGFI